MKDTLMVLCFCLFVIGGKTQVVIDNDLTNGDQDQQNLEVEINEESKEEEEEEDVWDILQSIINVPAKVVEIRPPPIISARRSSRLVQKNNSNNKQSNELLDKLAKKEPPPPQPDDQVKEGDPDLVFLSADGNISAVRRLLSVEGLDPNKVKNEARVGPLHAAAAGGHLAVAQLLVVYGADINQRTAYGRTPLFMAAKNGKESLVRYLLRRGATLEDRDFDGATALHAASAAGRASVVRHLLRKRAKVRAATDAGETPVMAASAGGHFEVVRTLAQYGARVKTKDEGGQTALHKAADNGHTNVARFLLRAGKASPNTADSEGRTPTWLACRGGYAQLLEILVGAGGDFGPESGAQVGATCAQVAAVNGHLDVIRLLVQFGLSQGDLDSSLSLALSNNHFPLVETLITAGAKLSGGSSKLNDLLVQSIVANESAVALSVVASGTELDFADSAGMTPLHLAARGGMLKVVEAILGKDKSLVDKVAEDGTTPLFWAAARGHLSIVKLLLDNGADLEHRDSSTRTPLMAALLGNRTEAAALLLARGADPAARTSPGGFTPLHLAVQQCSLDAVNLLVGQKGGKVDLEAKLVDGSSPLYLAAFKGFHRLADRLIEAGADTDTENNRGWTPLHMAANRGDVKTAFVLVTKGSANAINERTRRGETPLFLASRKGQLSVAKYLLESGASTEIPDLRNLDTPLHVSAAAGHFFVVDILLEFGADPTKRNADGRTALELAEEGRHQETVYLLAKPEYLAPAETNEDAR